MPGLERATDRHANAARCHFAQQGEAKLEVRREPCRIASGNPPRSTRPAHRRNPARRNVGSRKRSCSSVPQRVSALRVGRCARSARAARAAAVAARGSCCAVRRHFERAHLEQPEPAVGSVGRIQLVDAELGTVRVAGHIDQHVAQCAIDQPRRSIVGAAAASPQFCERNFQFVELVVARFIDTRRLAGRPDEQTGEQVRQRRMVVPVRNQAARADRGAAGTVSRPASRRPARCGCRRQCRCGARRA